MRSTTAMLMGVAGLLVCLCPPLLMGVLGAVSRAPVPRINGLILLPYLAFIGVAGLTIAVAALLAGISGVIMDVFLVVRIFTHHLPTCRASRRQADHWCCSPPWMPRGTWSPW